MALFTGKHVETTGVIIATAASALLLHGGHRIGALAGIAVYLIDRFAPAVFSWLSKFAEPTAWPGYVGLGVSALFAAHFGGWPAVAVIAGLFATGDGRLFNSLY